jgi:hypothetical protein
VSALRKLEWAKDTARWVTTNMTSKKGLKGRLVVVAVVGFDFYHVMQKRIAD